MKEIRLSDYLASNYETCYEDGESEWRRICALDKARNIVLLCSGLPHDSIIEIGAGEGSILSRLSELSFGEELYAIEISASGVETIKSKRIPRLVDCRIFDGYHAPYDNDRFDIAILSHVIEHVEHPRQLIYEASRVARYLFIEVPLEDTRRKLKNFLFDRVGHINFYSPRTIRWFVQSCNLRVLSQITTNPGKETYVFQKGRRGLVNYYVKRILLSTMPGLATKVFTYHEALVCERNVI